MGGPCTVDGVERKELDNFHMCQFEVDGVLWSSSEQYYQACKFPDNEEQREKIRGGDAGMGSWKTGQEVPARTDWEEVKVDMMYEANLAKFSQNPYLRDVLVSSQGPIHAQGGLFWKTWNEVLLERIREELRDLFGRPQRVPKVLLERKAAMEAYRCAAARKDEYAVQVATKYASQRLLMPAIAGNDDSLVLRGGGEDVDGVYQVDMLAPEANGQPHYVSKEGRHLYLGQKRGEQSWVIDEFYDPCENHGTAYVEASEGSAVPFGAHLWQVFDGSRHAGCTITILRR
jgi:ribA/ribD-fused uncharacterized protein